MILKLKNFGLLTGFALILSAASAQVTFDFDSGNAGADLNDLLSGATTSGGITLSATGFPDGSFNVTASGFGLNNAGSDDTDEFDPGQGFTFTFDTGVELNSLKVSSAVPEPTSFTALLGLSSLALVATRRRRQKPSPMLAA